MKRMACMTAAVLILWGASAATAQSLGDYARAARRTKPQQQASTSHHYDNDNLPKGDHLSVVGPEASDTAGDAQAPATVAPQTDASKTSSKDSKESSGPANDAQAPATVAPQTDAKASSKDPKAEAADRQKKDAEALQKKIDEQKQKIDAVNHELDLTQREYRLRAVAMYSDAGNRLRNAAVWDKEDAQYKQELADKQKALDAARQELESLQEEARKAGLKDKDQE
jgi:hypothetical protein